VRVLSVAACQLAPGAASRYARLGGADGVGAGRCAPGACGTSLILGNKCVGAFIRREHKGGCENTRAV
jgi:hypothetical protein